MAAMPWTQRDVSWLQFNERVLAQAMRADRPLLERCRFLGITAENLDEFIAVRLAKRRSKPDTAEKRRIDLVLQRSVETFGMGVSRHAGNSSKSSWPLSESVCSAESSGISDSVRRQQRFFKPVIASADAHLRWMLPTVSVSGQRTACHCPVTAA